jgi:hypothetical protein
MKLKSSDKLEKEVNVIKSSGFLQRSAYKS